MYTVYVLKSKLNGKLYTGQTDNLQRRVSEHNSGIGAKFTQENKPFRLVHFETYENRADAMQREKYLKTGKGREFIKKLLLDKSGQIR